MRKLYTTILLTLLVQFFISSPQQVSAQSTKTISGKVVDADDKTPIIGAAVVLKGSSKGTATDAEGNFKITIQGPGTLVVSFIGYEPFTVETGDNDHFDITLKKDNKSLNEVVVTALGISRQSKALGYAVQTVNTAQMMASQDPNLINNLNGKVAGVTITNGGAGVGSTSRIVIRGENSFSSSNQPLFVVDGVPINNETYFNNAIENSSNQGTWAEVDWGNGAAEVNPDDIDKVTVLKGPAAAALYGSRAANGAVVMTTKKGRTEKGLTGVTFNSTTTLETPLKLPHIQNEYGAGVDAYPVNGAAPNTYQYVNGTLSTENNIADFGLKFDPNLKVVQFDSPAGDGYQAADLVARAANPSLVPTPTPWVGHADDFKEFLQTGVTTQNSLGFGGTSDHGSYRFSANTMYNKGILPNTDLRRFGVSIRGNHDFSDKLTSDVFFNFINSSSENRPNIGYGSESVMYTFFGSFGMPTNVDIHSLKKMWQVGRDQQDQFRYWANHDNPYVTMYDNVNSFTKNRIIGNASLKYTFSPEWSAMLRTGSDFYADDREGHRAFTSVRFPAGGFRVDNVNYFENNTDFLVSYHKKPGSPFNVSVSAGGNRFMQNVSYIRDISNTLLTPAVYNFSNAASQLPTFYQKLDKTIYSLYAFADFDYKGLVFLDVTGRNDHSSTLPQGHNSYFYPSASLSGVISDMVKLPTAISYLKVRASAAEVGRDADPYSIYNTYIANPPFGATPVTTGSTILANPNLKPSITSTTEFGVEAKFLDNRIGLDATYYHARTKDEVVQLPIPPSSGYLNAFVNGGKIDNRGVEIMLSLTPFRSKTADGFNWDMNFNFSHNVGKVLSLADGVNSYIYAQVTQYDRYPRAVQYIANVGDKMGNMYGNGFQRDPATGKIVYSNGLPVLNSNQNTFLGNYNPDFILAWNNEFSYKNFNLSFLWDWHQGGKFFSYTALGIMSGGASTATLPGRETGIVGDGVMLDAASGKYVPNTVKVSAASYYGAYYNPVNNEAFMYDESYIKLRELRLGYTFKHVFGSNSKSTLNLSLVGRNLFEFTKDKDVDPETLALRGSQILPGTEFLSIPSVRSYGLSLGVKF